MEEEIINRVSQSNLVVIDLEEYYPKEARIVFDIKDWLYEGFILKEKEFRTTAKEYDWSQYQNTHVALTCSTDAIIPAWAFMLLQSYLQDVALTVTIGTLEDLDKVYYQKKIAALDVQFIVDKPVIVKGCSKKPVPENAYIQLLHKIQPHAKSIMYGEACSAVPIYKKPKSK